MHTPERALLHSGWALGPGVPFLEEGAKRALFFLDPALSILPKMGESSKPLLCPGFFLHTPPSRPQTCSCCWGPVPPLQETEA